MKRLALLVGLMGLMSGAAWAQNAGTNAPATNAPVKIAASEAKSHIDANASVTGKVAEVNVAERLVRLNFDNPFPKQVFTVVIFAAKTNLFPEIEKLKDKTVEVTGKISDYRGRPEIVLTSTNQLKIVETPTEKPADGKQ